MNSWMITVWIVFSYIGAAPGMYIGISTAFLTAVSSSAVAMDAGGSGKRITEATGLWDWVVLGGPVMFFIGLCSVIGLTIAVERFLALRRKKNMPEHFLDSVRRMMDFRGLDEALAYCRANPSSLSQVVYAALRRFDSGSHEMEQGVRDETDRLLSDLVKNIRQVGVFSQVSPLLGLAGTVLGMIGAFRKFSSGRTEAMGGDISAALITTLAGLAVAITLFLLYHWLKGRAELLARDIEDKVIAFILEIDLRHGHTRGRTIEEDLEADILTAEMGPEQLIQDAFDEDAATVSVTPAVVNSDDSPDGGKDAVSSKPKKETLVEKEPRDEREVGENKET